MFRRSILAAFLVLVSNSAMAQTWPNRPIRMIVPLAPGATADIIARIYADELGKALGQNIVVDNKTGAGGTIATAEGARSPADGYTILFISQGTVVFNIGLYAKPGYDPVRDFAPVALGGSVSNILVVNPSNPAKTVADVVAQAKVKPGEMTYSSGGTGTSQHMSTVLFERDTGIKMQHVPYRTTPAGIMGVVNGEVAMGFYNTPTVISLIQSGKLKAIAITSEERSPLMPEIPTMLEQGVKGFVFNTWMGFAVPKAAPGPIVARLNAELIRISQLPSVREKLGAQGIDLMPPESPAQVDKLLLDELALWVPIIKASGATAE
jgi:tripartite-type tricarboxylate transporter receptor subunit TctC